MRSDNNNCIFDNVHTDLLVKTREEEHLHSTLQILDANNGPRLTLLVDASINCRDDATDDDRFTVGKFALQNSGNGRICTFL